MSFAVTTVPSSLNSMTACDFEIAAICAAKSAFGDLLRRDVRGVLDDLERLAPQIEDGVVRGLDPDLLAALADPLVLRRLILAAVQLRPELPVLAARRAASSTNMLW